MTDGYKEKYDDLMKRCEEFNIWFEDHKRKSGHLTPTVIPTTAPWPPGSVNNICRTCGQDLSKLTNYVCYHPNCHQLFVGPKA
jgi:hypothetical protein